MACASFCVAAEEVWVEAKSPNFTVISNGSLKKARSIAKTLEQFRAVFQTGMPQIKIDAESSLIVVAVQDAKSMKALLPKERLQKGELLPAGIFMSGQETSFVVLRTDIPLEQGFHVVYHEYVHRIMNANFSNLPLWLSEGFAELYGNATVTDGESGIGKYSAEGLEALRSSGMIPLSVLMSADYDSPYYHKEDKARIFYAQAWALTHYLILGETRAHVKQLVDFLNLLDSGVPHSEATQKAFGDLKTLERNLEKYINLYAFGYIPVPIKLKTKEDQYEGRTLSQAESLALRGQVLVNANRLDEAKAMLEQALQLDPGNAAANVGLGLQYLRAGAVEESQKYFLAAADLDSKSYLAQYYAAQSAYESKQDYKAAENYLRKAIAVNPQFAHAFSMLSYVLLAQNKLQDSLLQNINAAGTV
jgi:tetratricopeptide (TPR) repeat protein